MSANPKAGSGYSGQDNGSDFDRLGHPGRYYQSIKFSGGQLDFTGSNYGYGSVIVKTGTGVTASLSGGGTVGLAELTAGTVYDLSLTQISGSVAANPSVYILKAKSSS